MELVDTRDLKSLEGNFVPVQVRPRLPLIRITMNIFSKPFIKKLKRFSQSNKLFSILISFGISMYKLINLVTSYLYFFYRLLFLKIRKEKSLRIAYIAPVHSPHFKNFKSTLDIHFMKDHEKLNLFINSYPTEVTKDFSKDMLLDIGLYKLLGYKKEAFSNNNWNKELLFKAKNNLNKISKIFIYNRIKSFKPDILWIHDLQSGGYLANHFIENLKIIFPELKIIASVCGNDLYFYQDHPLHKKQLKKLLSNIDYLHGESPRDGMLANKLGFVGKILPYSSITMTNIQDFENLRKGSLISKNKDIFLCVKGSYYLRSNLSYLFDQISLNPNYWRNKKIVFVGSSNEDNFFIEKLNNKFNLKIEYFSWIPFADYLKIMGRSKFHLVCNLSDGILNSAAESAFTDSMPIFSRDTGLCEFLDKELIADITYDFKDVSFVPLLENLVNDQNLYQNHLNSIKNIYRNNIYNIDI